MTIALDLGTSQFRTLRLENHRLQLRTVPARYAVAENLPEFRRQLERRYKGFVEAGRQLVLVGDTADLLAEPLGTVAQPLVDDGEFHFKRPTCRIAFQALLESILPPSATRGDAGDCLLTVPGRLKTRPADAPELLDIADAIRSFGFEPQIVSGSLATVLSEGEPLGYTAIGIAAGAGTIEISFVRHGRELIHTAVPTGGDWIDREWRQRIIALESETGGKVPGASQLRRIKADLDPSSRLDYQITLDQTYREAIAQAVQQFATALRDEPVSLPENLVALCSGGASLWPEFGNCLADLSRELDLPVRLREVRNADDAERTVLRGLLIHGWLERTHREFAA